MNLALLQASDTRTTAPAPRRGTAPIPRRLLALLVAGAVLMTAAPTHGQQVTLRHRMSAGAVSLYDVRLEILRTPADPDLADAHAQRLSGRLTRAFFHEAQPGQATCAQMVELEPDPDDEPVEVDLPAALMETLPLPPPRRVQLSVAPATVADAPFLVPARTSGSRAMLALLLPVAPWPEHPVAQGDTWEHAARVAGVTIPLTWRVERVESRGGDRLATVTVTSDVVAGETPRAARLPRSRATLVWSARRRDLLSLDGDVAYHEPVHAGGAAVTMRVEIRRTDDRMLSEQREATERQALIRLADAIAAYQREDITFARQALHEFKRRWPTSMWEPMAAHLAERIERERVQASPLPLAELRETLATLMALWASAEREHDLEVLASCRRSLAHITDVNREELIRLLDDDDAQLRTAACFAMAFGGVPGDLARLQERFTDEDARVRATALLATAIRGSPLADLDRIIRATRDAQPSVRRRACQALAASLEEDAAALPDARRALIARLEDDVPEVVFAAAEALRQWGTREDLEQIEQVARQTRHADLRAALEALLGTRDEP